MSLETRSDIRMLLQINLLLREDHTVHWRAGYGEKKFAAVIPVLSASNNVPKPKNIDFQISTWRNGDLDEILKLLVDI